jgi:hypothetical protein
MKERFTGILLGILLTLIAVSLIGLAGTNINGIGGSIISGDEGQGKIVEGNVKIQDPEHHLLSVDDMDKDGDGLCDICNIPVNDCSDVIQI